MPRLVRPLRTLRKGHVHEQHLVEIHRWVLEHDRPFHLANLEIEVLIRGRKRLSALRELLQFGQFFREVHLGTEVRLDALHELAGPANFLSHAFGGGLLAGLVEPVTLKHLAGFSSGQAARLGRRRSEVGGDRLVDQGSELNVLASRHDHLNPSRRESRRIAAGHEVVVLLPDLVQLLPFPNSIRRLVLPLALGQGLVFERQLDQPSGKLSLDAGIGTAQVFERLNAGPAREVLALHGEAGSQLRLNREGQIRLKASAPLGDSLPRARQRLGEGLAGRIGRADRFFHLARERLQSLAAALMQGGNLHGRERGPVNAQVIQHALEMLAHAAA